MVAGLRKRGRATARDYVWEKVIDQLLLRIDFAAARQAVAGPEDPLPKPAARRAARATRPRG